MREACNRVWPPPPVQAPKQWAFAKVDHLLRECVIQPGIGRRKLAAVLTPPIEDDHKRGLVTRAVPESTIYRSLKEEWGVWPVR